MKRYLRYIFLALIATFMTASCIEEMQFEQPVIQNDELALVPRVKSFANEYVTKATAYDDNEKKISSLAVLIFNSDGNLVHIQEAESVSSVKLNKSMLNTTAQKDKLSSATVVMIANISLDDIKKPDDTSIRDNKANLTLADMENYTCHFEEGKTVITSFGDDFTGFPMIGGVKGVDLTPTRSQQSAIEVGMKILYAKINFSIGVAAGDENTGTGMQFSLSGYSVHNTSQATSLAIPASKGQVDGATTSTAYEYKSDEGAAGSTTGTATLGGTPITFTFYVSESRYNHNSDLKGIYPSDDWLISSTNAYDEDVKGYTSMSDADKAANPLNGVKYYYDDIIQQYKPKLATVSTGKPASGLATYVLLNGTYTDYRGATWTVNYKVYLGKDNAHNFHVDRNSIYTNNITIKGIRNNDSFLDKDENGAVVEGGDQYVWIDHRVNVTDASDHANHVSITRETLIDSHIEVRPLRVNLGDEYAGVRVYLPVEDDGTLVDWIGIERFTGENCRESTTYCYQNGETIGKRKYFTSGLISELQVKEGEYGVNEDDNGGKYIYLLDQECAWIYFDENTGEERTAEIMLVFYTADGTSTSETYSVKQSGLLSVGGYNIESYEEYLHTYDSADKYSLSTSPFDYTQQGLAWDNKTGVNYSGTIVVGAANSTLLVGDNRYDYFHKSDQPSGNTYYSWTVDGDNYVARTTKFEGETGIVFTNRAAEKHSIKHHDMATLPTTAYQYCLSKNKFAVDEEGNVTMDVHWYLPDVYELQSALAATEDTAADFDADAYYWSSQPSYEMSLSTELIGFVNEVTDNARAVSMSATEDVSRTTQNRIRCFYSADGISLDKDAMADRTPDGIGGNYSFIMKAYDGTAEAYFNYMLAGATTTGPKKTTEEYKHTNDTYPYPTFANPGTYFGYFDNVVDENNVTVKGFKNYPLGKTYWDSYTSWGTTYYSALTTFPGLSIYELNYDNGWGGQGGANETTTEKSDTKRVTTITTKQFEENALSSKNLNTLDHLLSGDMLNISFSNNVNASYSPAFIYSEVVNGSTDSTTTREWQVPTYTKKSYRPKAESVTKKYTATELGTGTGVTWYGDKGKADATKNAQAAALAAAKKKAEDEYPNRTYSYGTTSYVDVDKGYTSSWSVTTYTMQSTCTIEITCTASADSVTYYENATGGGWDNGTTVTKQLDRIETDELRMYFGNSFTISLPDKYKDDYEITKVKVHCSGNTQFAAAGSGNNVHGRFVESGIKLPITSDPVSSWEATDKLEVPGMEYEEDVDSGTGWNQWSGSGTDSVTLVLSDYFINVDLDGFSLVTVYKYAKASTDLSKYIIIDKIEVKCTPKSTTTE